MTSAEHAIPIPILYEDVLMLYALSSTGSTPTHVVNSGGVWGEQLVWANRDVPNDPKFVSHIIYTSYSCLSLSRPRRFTRHDILETLSESTSRPNYCKVIALRYFLPWLTITSYTKKHTPSLIHHVQSQLWFTKV